MCLCVFLRYSVDAFGARVQKELSVAVGPSTCHGLTARNVTMEGQVFELIALVNKHMASTHTHTDTLRNKYD